jgi:hypothetical protein
MASPLDVARIVTKKAEDARLDEQVEISANNHFAFDTDCDHHCCCCCPGLALGVHI